MSFSKIGGVSYEIAGGRERERLEMINLKLVRII
jgi:hypothetical protein